MISHEVNLRQEDQKSSSLLTATQSQERFAAGLALIAGYIDACAFVQYKTYVSFMSGNTTKVGSLTGQGEFTAALPALLAIVFFVIGVFTGTLIANGGSRQPQRLQFGFVAALLVGNIGATLLMSHPSSGISVALLSLAMGLMNTVRSHVGTQSINLVFVTGTLTTLAKHLALALTHAPLPVAQGQWDTHRRRAFLLMGLWIALLTGAVLGGAVSYLGVGVLLFPALALVALAAFSSAPGE